jgi:MYXO-CTERM domain-containing protein
VQAEDEGPGRLVWAVDVLPSTRRAARYLVDAGTGEVVSHRPVALEALGRVYPVSSAVTPQTQDLPLTDMVVSAPQLLNGWSGNLTVTNYAGGNSQSGLLASQNLGPNQGADFLYDPPANPLSGTDAFAQVSVYYHLTRARDYFATTHDVNMTPSSWKLTAVANAQEDGSAMDNAYFSPMGIDGQFASPNLIAIGQGSQGDFAVDSDVFIHEFGHYVTGNAVGYNQGQFAFGEYGLSPWGGAIDEGIADYFACTVNGDSILGEASLAPFGAERDLSDTSRRCPDETVGEVHEDGKIIGSLSWSLRGAFGPALADRLVWGAITLLTPDATLGDFAKGLQQTAADFVAVGEMTAADAQTMDGLIALRGLDDCGNVLEVTASKPRRYIALGLTNLGYFFGASCGTLQANGIGLHSLFHFKVSPQPGDGGVRFVVDYDPTGGGGLDWGIYVRAGQHLGISDQTLMPTGATWSATHLSDTHGVLVIDGSSNPPFDPSQDYYMVVGDQSCPISYVTVSTDTMGSASTSSGAGGNGATGAGGGAAGGAGPGSGGDDNGDNGGADDGGCGCRAAGGAPGAPWALLAGLGLAGAASARRRRRARAAG